jgi:hypothetical protein
MIKRTGYATTVLCAACLCVTALTSCINESDAGCVQYSAKPCLEYNDGVEHSDPAVKSVKAYLFSDGKFDHSVEAGSDGRFPVSFDGSKSTTLVMLGYPDNDSLSVNMPKEGESISEVSLSLLLSKGNLSPEGFYYGRFDYAPSTSDTLNKEISVALYSKRATVKVVVENLENKYGSGGNYSIELSGFRSKVSFDGTIGGDSVTYSPKVAFDNSNNLCSDAVNTLPTKKGEDVTVTILRDDVIIWQFSDDSQGNAITLLGGDNKVVVVDVTHKEAMVFDGSSINEWQNEYGGSYTVD